MTRDIWLSTDFKGKEKIMADWLQQLYDIDNGTHVLTGKKEQGRLSKVKQELSTLVLNTVEWEHKK